MKTMKLAQLLNARADMQKSMKELRTRIQANLLVQEDEPAAESVAELADKYKDLVRDWACLVVLINETNMKLVTTSEGDCNTLMEMIVERDRFAATHKMYSEAASGLVPQRDRFSRNEIKYVPTASSVEMREKADTYAKLVRRHDDSLQELNWSIDVDVTNLGFLE